MCRFSIGFTVVESEFIDQRDTCAKSDCVLSSFIVEVIVSNVVNPIELNTPWKTLQFLPVVYVA